MNQAAFHKITESIANYNDYEYLMTKLGMLYFGQLEGETQYIILYGPPKSGKTTLLNILKENAPHHVLQNLRIPLGMEPTAANISEFERWFEWSGKPQLVLLETNNKNIKLPSFVIGESDKVITMEHVDFNENEQKLYSMAVRILLNDKNLWQSIGDKYFQMLNFNGGKLNEH